MRSIMTVYKSPIVFLEVDQHLTTDHCRFWPTYDGSKRDQVTKNVSSMFGSCLWWCDDNAGRVRHEVNRSQH
jgi:hypothetical protein